MASASGALFLDLMVRVHVSSLVSVHPSVLRSAREAFVLGRSRSRQAN